MSQERELVGLPVRTNRRTGAVMTVGELIGLLADCPQDAGVFFTLDDAEDGLSATRKPVTGVSAVVFQGTLAEPGESVGYVAIESDRQ